MQKTAESQDAESRTRKILVAIDDNYACEKALEWTLSQFYRLGDELHLIHVIPRLERRSSYGAPPVDILPQQGPTSDQLVIKQTETFILERFLPKLRDLEPQPFVHVEKGAQDTDSIGQIICEKAMELPAVAVVIASQGKSRFQQFFLGSTTAFVSKSCRSPVLIVH